MPVLPIGYNTFENADLDEAAVAISAVPSTLFGWHFFNDSAGSVYVRFYNVAAASVTVGTTAHVLLIGVPTLGISSLEIVGGIIFGTAISVATTTGPADNDTGAPGASALQASVFFLDGVRRQGI